ncbi:major facilitator superfamily protein [Artemisia annua]|uniref:Major facilitator superfamily protein n=1 Tax=Artemisia annua TaxID=35608 RepID=A0A2U1L6N2_ARTAN|nr:major facilitator superfamily protein [Artemisia annua]
MSLITSGETDSGKYKLTHVMLNHLLDNVVNKKINYFAPTSARRMTPWRSAKHIGWNKDKWKERGLLILRVAAGSEQKLTGRSADAEAEFVKILGGLHAKSLVAQLSKTDRGDEVDGVKLSELFYGRHFRGIDITTVVFLYSDEIYMFFPKKSIAYYAAVAMSMGMQAVARSSLVSGSPVVYLSVGG